MQVAELIRTAAGRSGCICLRWASRICSRPERTSAWIIETGFLSASVRRSGRSASSVDEGRPLRMSRYPSLPKVCRTPGTPGACDAADAVSRPFPEARSVRRGLSGIELPSFAGFAALHYCDLSYKSFQSRSAFAVRDFMEHGAWMRWIREDFGRCQLICRRGVRWGARLGRRHLPGRARRCSFRWLNRRSSP
jgi:hypothetical protein